VRDLLGDHLPAKDLGKSVLCRTVPRRVICRYTEDPLRLAAAVRLFGSARDATPYQGDFLRSRSLLRALYLALHTVREAQKFHRYAPRVR
jgi:hypothetical protein